MVLCIFGTHLVFYLRAMKFNILDLYTKFINVLIVVLMYILLLDVTIQVFGRYVSFIPRFLWTIEFANFILIWIVFLGSIIAVKHGKHFFVNCFSDDISLKFEYTLRIIYYVVMFIVTFVFIIFGFKFFKIGCKQGSMILGINLGIIHISVPFTGISWLIFLVDDFYKDFIKK